MRPADRFVAKDPRRFFLGSRESSRVFRVVAYPVIMRLPVDLRPSTRLQDASGSGVTGQEALLM